MNATARKIETAPVTIASVIADRKVLVKALKEVLPAIDKSSDIPLLRSVRIGIADGLMTLGTSDLDIHLVTSIAAETEGSGAVAMEWPARLASLLGKMSGPTVDLSLVEQGGGRVEVLVSSGAIQAEFPTQNVEDFPALPAVSDKALTLHFGGAQLLEAIDRTSFAVSTEETRYYLNGIYLHAAKSGEMSVLRAVATDGHRLALTDIASDLSLPENDSLPEGWGAIIPRKAISLLNTMARAGAVETSFWGTWVCAKSGASTLYSKLIDGTFPDYQRVIPSGNDKSATIPTDLLRVAVARVALAVTDKTKACKITLSQAGITLQSCSPEGMSITETLELPEKPNLPAHTAFEHGLNARYLSEALRKFPGAATYRWADHASPIVIYAADITQAEATHLVVQMPMRV